MNLDEVAVGNVCSEKEGCKVFISDGSEFSTFPRSEFTESTLSVKDSSSDRLCAREPALSWKGSE